MTGSDIEYINFVINKGLIYSPCLEVGAGLEGFSAEAIITSHGISYHSTDIKGSVSLTTDFERSDVAQLFNGDQFGTVMILNVLEHVFDPIRVLDNAVSLVRSGGTCVVIAPSVWPLHYFPLDCWRINP